MRPKLPAVALVLIFVALMLAACGGADSPVAPEPHAEATTVPAAAVSPTATAVPAGQRESTQPPTTREGGSTASIPATEASQPTLPAQGTPTQAQTAEPTPAAAEQATEPAPTTATAPQYVELTSVPCVDDFRQMLLNYDGPEEFGPEVAQRLSDEFVARRTDCAEKGWNPGFPLLPAGQVHGVRNCFRQDKFRAEAGGPDGSGYQVGSIFIHHVQAGPGLKPTMKSGSTYMIDGRMSYASVLVHFDPVPFDPGLAGCWYTHGNRGWYWLHFHPSLGEVQIGYDPVRLPECEALLRTVLEDLWISGEDLGMDGILSARDTVISTMPGICGNTDYRGAWNLFPQAGSRSGCALEAPTGVQSDSTLVVNWHPDFPDAFGGSACWVYSPEGEWSFYAASDGGG